MNKAKKYNPTKSKMEKILNDPRYKGKHVIVVNNKVFTSNTGEKARKTLERVRQQYPKATPAVTYIPDADTLILWKPLRYIFHEITSPISLTSRFKNKKGEANCALLFIL